MVTMSRPSMSTSPAVGSMSRLMQRTSVDLPLPDRPMTTMISPSCTSKLASATPTPHPVWTRISALDVPFSSIGMARSGWCPKILYKLLMRILGGLDMSRERRTRPATCVFYGEPCDLHMKTGWSNIARRYCFQMYNAVLHCAVAAEVECRMDNKKARNRAEYA